MRANIQAQGKEINCPLCRTENAFRSVISIEDLRVQSQEEKNRALLNASLTCGASQVSLLLKSNAQVDATGKMGWTSLQITSQVGNADIVKTLVESGAEVYPATQEGWTSLHVASQNAIRMSLHSC